MIESLHPYIAEWLIAIGILILAIEIGILGFATFILFFVGLALITNGVLIWLGLVPETLTAILLTTAIISALFAGVLWKPLRKLQNKTEKRSVQSDFVGIQFFAPDNIDKRGLCTHTYSGIQWKLKSDQPISAGSEVEVIRAEVGTFWVKAIA